MAQQHLQCVASHPNLERVVLQRPGVGQLRVRRAVIALLRGRSTSEACLGANGPPRLVGKAPERDAYVLDTSITYPQ